MATKRPRMKTSDILALDDAGIKALKNKGELKQATQALVDAANKRIKRLEESGLDYLSEAHTAVEQGGTKGQGKFTTKGKTGAELRLEFERVRGFMLAKTSTIKGTKETKALLTDQLGEEIMSIMTPENWRKMWEAIDKFRASSEYNGQRLNSSRIREIAAEIVKRTDENATADTIQNFLHAEVSEYNLQDDRAREAESAAMWGEEIE